MFKNINQHDTIFFIILTGGTIAKVNSAAKFSFFFFLQNEMFFFENFDSGFVKESFRILLQNIGHYINFFWSKILRAKI